MTLTVPDVAPFAIVTVSEAEKSVAKVAVLEKDKLAVMSTAAAFDRDIVSVDVPPFSAIDEDELVIVTEGFAEALLPPPVRAATPKRAPPTEKTVLLANLEGTIIFTAEL